jgi:hypothetical protein
MVLLNMLTLWDKKVHLAQAVQFVSGERDAYSKTNDDMTFKKHNACLKLWRQF